MPKEKKMVEMTITVPESCKKLVEKVSGDLGITPGFAFELAFREKMNRFIAQRLKDRKAAPPPFEA